MCRRLFLVFLLIIPCRAIFCQDTLHIRRKACESIFLKENLQLIAERLNIPIARANLIQTKLWPNPTLTIDQVNFWAKPYQTGGNEAVPPMGNGFGRNQQFAFELEQIIQTAGKRRKLIALSEISVHQAELYFQELLRNMKFVFRTQLNELYYIQRVEKSISEHLQSFSQLVSLYEKQSIAGNIAQNYWHRLKTQEFSLQQELNFLKMQNQELQASLKALMNLPSEIELCLEADSTEYVESQYKNITWEKIFTTTKTQRPDYLLAQSELLYEEKKYQLEKSKRIPDLYLKGGYDRNGNAMLDFVGFGITTDLPFFNRNQGNIRAASLAKEQADWQLKYKERVLESELMKSYRNFLLAQQTYQQTQSGFDHSLESMLDAYTRNFQRQHISMLEYLDFTDAYLNYKKNYWNTVKTYHNSIEELNYNVGIDIVNDSQ